MIVCASVSRLHHWRGAGNASAIYRVAYDPDENYWATGYGISECEPASPDTRTTTYAHFGAGYWYSNSETYCGMNNLEPSSINFEVKDKDADDEAGSSLNGLVDNDLKTIWN